MDFTCLTVPEIAAFVAAHQGEMGANGINDFDVLEKLESRTAELETREYGFAIIQLELASDGKLIPHLWLLFVGQEHRQRGLGHRFMREILRKYCTDYHMSLYCDGPRRRAFFGRLGFRIESRDGEMRRMTTNEIF